MIFTSYILPEITIHTSGCSLPFTATPACPIAYVKCRNPSRTCSNLSGKIARHNCSELRVGHSRRRFEKSCNLSPNFLLTLTRTCVNYNEDMCFVSRRLSHVFNNRSSYRSVSESSKEYVTQIAEAYKQDGYTTINGRHCAPPRYSWTHAPLR